MYGVLEGTPHAQAIYNYAVECVTEQPSRKRARDPEYSDREHMHEELLYKIDCNVQSILSVTKKKKKLSIPVGLYAAIMEALQCNTCQDTP